MNEKYEVLCKITQDEKVIEGQKYITQDHPIDKSLFYIVHEGNEWRMYKKENFQYVVTKIMHYNKYYSESQPIIEEVKMMVAFLTADKLTQHASKGDIDIEELSNEIYVDCK